MLCRQRQLRTAMLSASVKLPVQYGAAGSADGRVASSAIGTIVGLPFCTVIESGGVFVNSVSPKNSVTRPVTVAVLPIAISAGFTSFVNTKIASDVFASL